MQMHVTFDSLKTFYNILLQKLNNHRGNWEQNDPTADDYIKNRPFYSKSTIITLIDNLTLEDYNNGNYTGQTFIVGQSYNVIWNGILYENLICFTDGTFNIIANDVVYIDDDGGNSLFVEANDGSEDWTLSILTKQEVVHQIDSKYVPIPNGIVTKEDLSTVALSGDYQDLINQPTIYSDVVRYDALQELTNEQKQIARDNIDAIKLADVYNMESILKWDWDGDVSGKDSFRYNAFPYYKISNKVLDFQTIKSATSEMSDGRTFTDLYQGTNCYRAGLAIVVTKAGDCALQVDETNNPVYYFNAPSTGVYFFMNDTIGAYCTSLILSLLEGHPVGVYFNSTSGNEFVVKVTDDGSLTTENDVGTIVEMATTDSVEQLKTYIDSLAKVYAQPDEPAIPKEGDIWIDTDENDVILNGDEVSY